MKTGPPRYRGYSRFCFVQCPSTLLSFTCVAFVSYAQGIESSSPTFLPVKPEVCACDSEAPDTLVRELTSLSLFLHVIDFTPLIFRFNSSVLATLCRPCRCVIRCVLSDDHPRMRRCHRDQTSQRKHRWRTERCCSERCRLPDNDGSRLPDNDGSQMTGR